VAIRYLARRAKTFRWRPHGAVLNYFRQHALLDYYRGGDGHGAGLLLVHGASAAARRRRSWSGCSAWRRTLPPGGRFLALI